MVRNTIAVLTSGLAHLLTYRVLAIAISVVVTTRVRRQSGASPAVAVTVAVIVRTHLHRQRGASPAIAVVTHARHQGMAPRRN